MFVTPNLVLNLIQRQYHHRWWKSGELAILIRKPLLNTLLLRVLFFTMITT